MGEKDRLREVVNKTAEETEQKKQHEKIINFHFSEEMKS